MVGVPRSKGCLACLQRQVKCDEAQPGCQSCQRRGHPCPGYIRDRKFYHRFASSTQHQSKDKTSQARATKLTTALATTGEVQRRASIAYASIDDAIIPGLVSKALDQQCRRGFCDFVDTVFPNIYYSYSTRVELPWFSIAQDEKGTTKSLDYGFRSLGCLQMGRANGNQRLVLASQEFYGRGLRTLSQALKNPATAGADVTLAAAILLGIYELMNATAEASWLLHSRGISHLFRLRTMTVGLVVPFFCPFEEF